MPEIKLKKEQKNSVIIGIDIYFKVSLLCTHGVWIGKPKQFQYDMILDAQIYTRAQAKKEFLKMALEYYNESNKAKEGYLKWLLNLR